MYTIGTCHVCFAEHSLQTMLYVKIEKLDESVHICTACVYDVYTAFGFSVNESDE